MGIDNPLNKDS